MMLGGVRHSSRVFLLTLRCGCVTPSYLPLDSVDDQAPNADGYTDGKRDRKND
jgi:hypothetical protein